MMIKLGPDLLKRVTSPYGSRIHPVTGEQSFHNGIDISLRAGDIILAPFDGVVKVDWNKLGGNQVFLTSLSEPKLTLGLAHLKSPGNPGPIREGEPLAVVGATGRTTGPHLHLTARLGGRLFNPEALLQHI